MLATLGASAFRFGCVVVGLALGASSALAGELLLAPEKIVGRKGHAIPQAPRLSPDGMQMTYELYTNNRKVTIWRAASDGNNPQCLTCSLSGAFENAYWHPSGRFIVFNRVPVGTSKTGDILVGELTNAGLGRRTKVASGARPQFSRPNGTTIFFERTTAIRGSLSNVLAYRVLGPDPLLPSATVDLDLRGPIEKVNRQAEVSHPSLAPDGTTIVFAARIGVVSVDEKIVLDDAARQKIYKLWRALVARKTLPESIVDFRCYNEASALGYADDEGGSASDPAEPLDGFRGFTVGDLGRACVLGITKTLDPSKDAEVREILLPRLWTTDVFGAPITPLVKDLTSAPLPQKWATISRDGRFAVFEAGLYTERHVYLIMKKDGGTWMDRAVKLTELGTYNSSPELDPTGQWLCFESNRGREKAIWRARLDWDAIRKAAGVKS